MLQYLLSVVFAGCAFKRALEWKAALALKSSTGSTLKSTTGCEHSVTNLKALCETIKLSQALSTSANELCNTRDNVARLTSFFQAIPTASLSPIRRPSLLQLAERITKINPKRIQKQGNKRLFLHSCQVLFLEGHKATPV